MTGGKSHSIALAWGALACAGLAACAASRIAEPPGSQDPAAVEDPPARSGGKALLIAMPESRDFVEARKGLVAEVKKDFNVTTFMVTPTTTVDDLAGIIERTSPACLVLMNNTALALFQKYQARPGLGTSPPAVVLMTSFLEEASRRVKHITGIAYEVPGVTAFIHLRMVVTAPINRIAVVFRPAFAQFIERQIPMAAREGIEVVPVAVPREVNAERLRSALRTLSERGRVDALWLLNDNELIRNAAFISETWRPVLRDLNIPLIVGVPNLVDPAEPFGTMAVVPDHEALGLQAANLIFDLADNNWQAAGHPIEQPLSVKTVVDIKQAREHFGLSRNALQHVDRALE